MLGLIEVAGFAASEFGIRGAFCMFCALRGNVYVVGEG